MTIPPDEAQSCHVKGDEQAGMGEDVAIKGQSRMLDWKEPLENPADCGAPIGGCGIELQLVKSTNIDTEGHKQLKYVNLQWPKNLKNEVSLLVHIIIS